MKSLKVDKGTATAEIAAKDGAQTLKVDRVILAVGIVGNVENLGLEGARREDREDAHRGRRLRQDGRAGPLCHRRSHRAALAGAQGDA